MGNDLYFYETDEEAIRALEAEGRRLKYIALKLWRSYLGSYQPSEYIRTRRSQRAIKLGKVKRLDAYTFGIELTFVDELLYHDSVIGKGQPKGHSIMLISEGWKLKKTARGRKPVYRFDYYEGFDYLSKLIATFNDGARKGITLEVNWAGEPYKKGNPQKNVLK